MSKKILTILFVSFVYMFSYAQSHHIQKHGKIDPKYSVFGPPRADIWEFQLASWNFNDLTGYAFNFYKINQRNKTVFFRYMDSAENNQEQSRTKQLAGGLSLFPINNDDRFQIDVGAIYNFGENMSLTSNSLYSRVTFRPIKKIWLRVGFELAGEKESVDEKGEENINNNAAYFAGRYDIGRFSIFALLGTAKIDGITSTRYGTAGLVKGPFNTFFLGGKIISDLEKDSTRTIGFGRWAPFRPDGLPSGIFIWKHRQDYDFQLGGIFWGKTNAFVRPAALGMTQGIFVSSMALIENSILRQKQLMTITSDYRNSDFSIFYVYLKKGIEIIPGNVNYIGFRAIQLFKIFKNIKYSFISKPVVGIFYNEETEPEFDHASRTFKDLNSTSISYQLGLTLFDNYILNIINDPSRDKFTIGLSFLYR